MDQPFPEQPKATPARQPAKQQSHQDPASLALSRQVADLLSRLRLLEGRYANLRREHQLTSHNMIEHHQNLAKQQRKLSDQLLELKRNVRDLKEQLDTMTGELADAATHHDLQVLERYLDFWQPMDFLTRNEAEKLIAERLATRKKTI